jgi:hypothetical protein
MSFPVLNTTFSLKVQRALNQGAQLNNPNNKPAPFLPPPIKWQPPMPGGYPMPGYCKCPAPVKQPPRPLLVKDPRPLNWRNDGGAFDPPIHDETMRGWGDIGAHIGTILPQIVSSVPGAKQPTTLDKILITGSSVGSQLIAAFGRNPTQQVSYPGAQIIPYTGGQQTHPIYQQQPQLTPQQMQAYYQANTPGAGVGQGIDGIFDWISKNPMIVLAAGAGAYLLFRQPPGKR